MSETVKYVANGRQTYLPCQDNVNVPFVAYEKPEKPNPLLPELELNQDAIDIGNEGEGLSQLVRKNCDVMVSIPMKGKISSLNASAAASILLYETVRQRIG